MSENYQLNCLLSSPHAQARKFLELFAARLTHIRHIMNMLYWYNWRMQSIWKMFAVKTCVFVGCSWKGKKVEKFCMPNFVVFSTTCKHSHYFQLLPKLQTFHFHKTDMVSSSSSLAQSKIYITMVLLCWLCYYRVDVKNVAVSNSEVRGERWKNGKLFSWYQIFSHVRQWGCLVGDNLIFIYTFFLELKFW